MDATQRLAFECEVSAAVLGKGDDFSLLDLSTDISSATLEAARRGYYYCGAIGIKDGRVLLEIASPDPDTVRLMGFAVAEFAKHQVAPNDGADWLEQLHRLPDTRES